MNIDSFIFSIKFGRKFLEPHAGETATISAR